MKPERSLFRIAVLLLLVDKNKVLLMRRYKTGWKDGWYTLPGGHLENNESLTQSMIRETLEETGILIKENNLKFIHLMYIKSDLNYLFTFYTSSKWKGEAKLMESNKCDDLQWFDLKKLPKKTLGPVKQVIEYYKKDISYSEITIK